jgi:hypothetical protein
VNLQGSTRGRGDGTVGHGVVEGRRKRGERERSGNGFAVAFYVYGCVAGHFDVADQNFISILNLLYFII